MRAARELVFSGMVQGIGFRWTAKRIADSLGVSGWVRNNPDGSVSAAVEGADGDLDSFVERLDAALGRYITAVRSKDVKPGKNSRGFDIVR